jgi:Tfp pilus assembly protein PilP
MIKCRFIISNILMIIFVVAFFGFAQEDEKSSDTVSSSVTAPAPAATQSAIQQLTTSISQTAGDTYNYNPSAGKPDPFRPFVEIDIKKIDETKNGKKETSSSIFPLQRAATEKFKVVGIASDKIHRVAIVEDAAKKFYPLFKGTYIGLKNGRVVEIMADRVIVEEREEKENMAKRIILKLRKD